MEFFHGTKIDFVGKRYLYFGLSLTLILISIGAFVQRRGPVLGLEFTGGTLLQVGFNELPPIDDVRSTLTEGGYQGFALQTQPSNKAIIIKVKGSELSKDDLAANMMSILKTKFSGNVKPVPDRVEFIGPVFGKKLVMDTYKAIFGSLTAILLYVAFRFNKFIWGFAGVLALAHDVFITWGLLTLLNRETTLVVIAALLTLAGYSINDTIVIFDRVRESLRTARKETMLDIYNRSLNETLGRTVNTSATALVAALCLYFLGGEVIRDFSLAMAFGIFIGAYSTVGVALGLVYEIERRQKKV